MILLTVFPVLRNAFIMNYKEYWTQYTKFVVKASEVIKLIEIYWHFKTNKDW